MTSPNAEQDQSTLRKATKWPISRRAVLKTGALTSGALTLGTTGPAAAQRNEKGDVRERVPVIDSDDPDPDTAIVINVLDVPINDWNVYGNETVADQNPTYDPENQVVVVAFEHLLDAGWPEWRRANPDTLFDGVVDRGIKFHAFPKARLQRGRSNGDRNSR